MEENKPAIQAGVIGYCLPFVVYQWFLNSGGFLGWTLTFLIPAAVAAAAYFVAKQMG